MAATRRYARRDCGSEDPHVVSAGATTEATLRPRAADHHGGGCTSIPRSCGRTTPLDVDADGSRAHHPLEGDGAFAREHVVHGVRTRRPWVQSILRGACLADATVALTAPPNLPGETNTRPRRRVTPPKTAEGRVFDRPDLRRAGVPTTPECAPVPVTTRSTSGLSMPRPAGCSDSHNAVLRACYAGCSHRHVAWSPPVV